MDSNNSKKTGLFIIKGIGLWIIMILIYLLINFLIQTFGDIPVKGSVHGYFFQLNEIILYFLILLGIPMTLVLSVVLLYAEKLIDKLAERNKRKKEQNNK